MTAMATQVTATPKLRGPNTHSWAVAVVALGHGRVKMAYSYITHHARAPLGRETEIRRPPH